MWARDLPTPSPPHPAEKKRERERREREREREREGGRGRGGERERERERERINLLANVINPYMPRDVFIAKYPAANGRHVCANGDLLLKKKKGGEKYSATSSLNKGSPCTQVYVSWMSNLLLGKTP